MRSFARGISPNHTTSGRIRPCLAVARQIVAVERSPVHIVLAAQAPRRRRAGAAQRTAELAMHMNEMGGYRPPRAAHRYSG